MVRKLHDQRPDFNIQGLLTTEGRDEEEDDYFDADILPIGEMLEAISAWSPPCGSRGEPTALVLIVAGGLMDPVSRVRGRLAVWTDEARLLDGPLTFSKDNSCGTRPFTQQEVNGQIVLVLSSAEASSLKQVLNAGSGNASGILIADNEGDSLCRVPLPKWASRLVVPTAFVSLADGLALADRLGSEGDHRLELAAVAVPSRVPGPAPPVPTPPLVLSEQSTPPVPTAFSELQGTGWCTWPQSPAAGTPKARATPVASPARCRSPPLVSRVPVAQIGLLEGYASGPTPPAVVAPTPTAASDPVVHSPRGVPLPGSWSAAVASSC